MSVAWILSCLQSDLCRLIHHAETQAIYSQCFIDSQRLLSEAGQAMHALDHVIIGKGISAPSPSARPSELPGHQQWLQLRPLVVTGSVLLTSLQRSSTQSASPAHMGYGREATTAYRNPV